jgi:hypothetical protein
MTRRETVADVLLIVSLTRVARAVICSHYGDISPYRARSPIGVRCSHVEAVVSAVVDLSVNALLRHGQPMSAENQCENVWFSGDRLAPIAQVHPSIVSCRNGPQTGLLTPRGRGSREGA